MAELMREAPPGVDVDGRWLRARPRMSWGAIFAGAIPALGMWLLLYAFGLAVGLSAVDGNDAGSLRASGIFTGIWGLVAPLVALFTGGFVAARVSGAFTRGEGAVHGLVVWGLATVAGAYMVVTTLATILGGVASLRMMSRAGTGTPGGAAAAAVSGDVGTGPTSAWTAQDAEAILRPFNQRLRIEGKSTVSPFELQAVTRDVASTTVGQARFDEDLVTMAITRNTPLSQPDAQELAARLEDQYSHADLDGDPLGGAGVHVEAARAAEASSRAFWGMFGALLLGLVAALVGGAVGVPSPGRQRPERTPTLVTPPNVGPPREAYP